MEKEGAGRFPLGSAFSETVPSRRPAGTEYLMPPSLKALSRAAKARMSAQETVCGQSDSSSVFAESMTSKPRRLGLFAGCSFSAGFSGVESRSTDASQP